MEIIRGEGGGLSRPRQAERQGKEASKGSVCSRLSSPLWKKERGRKERSGVEAKKEGAIG
jgi:hypothetical protein